MAFSAKRLMERMEGSLGRGICSGDVMVAQDGTLHKVTSVSRRDSTLCTRIITDEGEGLFISTIPFSSRRWRNVIPKNG